MSYIFEPKDTDLSVWTLSSCEEDESLVDDPGAEDDGEDLFIPLKNEKGYFTISSKPRISSVKREDTTQDFSESNGSLEICNIVPPGKENCEEGSATKKSAHDKSSSKRKQAVLLKDEESSQGKPSKTRRRSSVKQIHENGNNGDEEVISTDSKSVSRDEKEVDKRTKENPPTTVGDDGNKDGAVITKLTAKELNGTAIEDKHGSFENGVEGKRDSFKGFKRSSKGGVKCSSCKTRFTNLQDFAKHVCSPSKNAVDNTENTEKSGESPSGKSQTPLKSSKECNYFNGKESLIEKYATPLKTMERTLEEAKISSATVAENKEFHLRSGHRDVTSQYQRYVTAWKANNSSSDSPEMNRKDENTSPFKKKRKTTVSDEPTIQKKRRPSSHTSEPTPRLPKAETQGSFNNKLSVSYSSFWQDRETKLNKKYRKRDSASRREMVTTALVQEKRTGASEWCDNTCPVCSKKLYDNRYVVQHLKSTHVLEISKDDVLCKLVFGYEGMPKKSCSLCSFTCKSEDGLEKHLESRHKEETVETPRRVSRNHPNKKSNAKQEKVIDHNVEGFSITPMLEEQTSQLPDSFKCEECNKEFKNISDLEQHLSEAHLQELSDDSSKSGKRSKRQKTHACAVCSQEFEQSLILKKHLWLRHKLKKNVFIQTSDQKNVEKTSDSKTITSHVCFICNISFRDLAQLIRHKQSKHTEAKSEPLKRMKRSELEASMDDEERRLHKQRTKYSDVCTSCSRFSRPILMKKYLKKELGNQETMSQVTDGLCQICNEEVPNSSSKKTAAHRCGKCSLNFNDFASFRKHCQIHATSKSNGDKLEHSLHDESDSEDDPSYQAYECGLCDSTFTKKQQYEAHLEKNHKPLGNRNCRLSGKKEQARRSRRTIEEAPEKNSRSAEVSKDVEGTSNSRRSVRSNQDSPLLERYKPVNNKQSSHLQKDEEKEKEGSEESQGTLSTDIEGNSSMLKKPAADSHDTGSDLNRPKRNPRKSKEARNESITKKQDFSCSVRGRRFPTRRSVGVHRVKSECGKPTVRETDRLNSSSTRESSSDEHNKSMNKSFFCTHCNIEFSRSQALAKHNKSCKKVQGQKKQEENASENSGEKIIHKESVRPYCNSCNKVFQSAIQLVAHKKGECPHQRRKSGDQKRGYCEHCKKTYMNFTSWDNHLSRCERKFETTNGGEEKSKEGLVNGPSEKINGKVKNTKAEKEMEKQANVCKWCEKSFDSPRKLIRHTKKTLCRNGARRLSKVSPKFVRENLKEYRCDICEHSFLSKEQMLKHKDVHKRNSNSSSGTALEEELNKQNENLESPGRPKSRKRSRSSRRKQSEDAQSPLNKKSLARSKSSDETEFVTPNNLKKSRSSRRRQSEDAQSPLAKKSPARSKSLGEVEFVTPNNLQCSVCHECFDKSWKLRRHHQMSHASAESPDSHRLSDRSRSCSMDQEPALSNTAIPGACVSSITNKGKPTKTVQMRSSLRSADIEERQTAQNSFSPSSTIPNHLNRFQTSLNTSDQPTTSAVFSTGSSSVSNREEDQTALNSSNRSFFAMNLPNLSSTFPNNSNRSFTSLNCSNQPSTLPSSTASDSFSCVCQFCNQGFNKRMDLINHMVQSHSQEDSVNEGTVAGNAVSPTASRSYRHFSTNPTESGNIEIVRSRRENTCHTCGEQFSEALSLQAHFLECHVSKACNVSVRVNEYSSPRLQPCVFCNEVFNDPFKMQLHTLEKHRSMSSLPDNFIGQAYDNCVRQRNDEEQNMKLYKHCIAVALASQASTGEPVEEVTMVKVKFQNQRTSTSICPRVRGSIEYPVAPW